MEKWVHGAVLIGLGGGVYVMLECVWRGFSHPSMFLVGGLCFWLLSYVPATWPRQWQVLCSASVITVLEFVSGCIVNLWLGWNVWDYGLMWGNVLGQICLLYACFWVGLSIPALWLNRQVRGMLSHAFHRNLKKI